jgi:hypothetical protein
MTPLRPFTHTHTHTHSHTHAPQLFSPQPRAAIQTALAYPRHYLNCTCCPDSVADAAVLASMPDASIAYNLYLECGKMINVADFFTSFCAVLEEEESEELQARFMLVLSGRWWCGAILLLHLGVRLISSSHSHPHMHTQSWSCRALSPRPPSSATTSSA